MAALRHPLALRLAVRLTIPHRPRLGVRCLATAKAPPTLFSSLDTFTDRHVGPDERETTFMLSELGYDSLDAFLSATVPSTIRIPAAAISDISMPALSESELHARAKALGNQNSQFKSYIGMGYHNAVVPPVILRNVRIPHLHPVCVVRHLSQIMENPAWYTPYTPYQPEIAQGLVSRPLFLSQV